MRRPGCVEYAAAEARERAIDAAYRELDRRETRAAVGDAEKLTVRTFTRPSGASVWLKRGQAVHVEGCVVTVGEIRRGQVKLRLDQELNRKESNDANSLTEDVGDNSDRERDRSDGCEDRAELGEAGD